MMEKRSFCRGKSAPIPCTIRSKRIQNMQSLHSRPTLKDVEYFRNGSVREPYERSLYKQTFMREPFIEKHAISNKLSNVNREEQKHKSHCVCRCDHEPRRIPIRSLKSLRNKSRRFENMAMRVFFRVYPCHLHGKCKCI